MATWGGALDGTLSPGTFSSVDANGSLYVVYDVNRPESDGAWNGAYICINPGGSFSSSLSTLWRKIADDSGFVNSNGAMTLTSPLPSAAYAVQGMTYELFRTFTPDQWMNAANYAMRNAYPQRHRLVHFEAPEDPNTRFYDWGHLASQLAITDPTTGPTVNVIADPGGTTNTWQAGIYKIAYNIWNGAGESLVSSTTSVTLSSGQIIEIQPITVPEQAIGVNYFCTPDPGGSVLSQFSVGSGILPNPNVNPNVNQQVGFADPTTFIVPAVRFWGAPPRAARTNPAFNTSSIDPASLSLKNIKRRVNPGQYPERFIELNPDWWREVGGTEINIEMRPLANYNLRFELIGPVRSIAAENDTTEEPREILIAGSMLYLWNQLLMTGSAQNVQAWQAEAKIAEARYNKAKNLYQMPGPRKTMRVPRISISRYWIDSPGT